MKSILPAIAIGLATLSPQASASPLKDASFHHIVNDVEVVSSQGGRRRATEHQVFDTDASVRAGSGSRAEIIFGDHTLARVGAETALKLHPGTRELTLDRGTLLLQVPKFRGGARIRAGALALACGGATILVEHLPGNSLKAVVLEGELRVSVARFLGDSIVVSAGKMLIVNPDVKRIPDPVDTDLRTLVSTSALINSAAFGGAVEIAPLPSLPQIVREIARQENAIDGKRLIRTNLAIFGSGTSVVIPAAVKSENAGSVSAIQNRERVTLGIAEPRASLAAGRPVESGTPLPEP